MKWRRPSGPMMTSAGGAEDWTWRAPGGNRSIKDMVQHVGACKLMYEKHGFGDAALHWENPVVDSAGEIETPDAAIGWLRSCHARLRQSIAALDDGELTRRRATAWGEPMETRWIVSVMIEHDLYHGGEINHIRALHHDNDR